MSVMDSGASGDICSPLMTAAASIRNEGGLGNDILAFYRVWSQISGCGSHPLVCNLVTEKPPRLLGAALPVTNVGDSVCVLYREQLGKKERHFTLQDCQGKLCCCSSVVLEP